MRVILNDRCLFRPLTGVGHYVRLLIEALRDCAADVELQPLLSGLLRRRPAAPQDGATPRRTRLAGSPGLRALMRPVLQRGYGLVLRSLARGFDLYHEPNHIPLPCGRPTITTIHDLSGLLYPQWHPPDRVRWYERHFARALSQSRCYLTVSQFTRDEMVRHLGIEGVRIFVSPLPARLSRPAASAIDAVRRRLDVPERFFLFVGTFEPRKNVTTLLDAYAALPADVRRRHPLLLAGARGWQSRPIEQELARRGLGDAVRVLEYLGDAALAALYSTATALVWPTLYEGFGLPPLEALACGCPVIVSDVASLPEVVGDAGVRLDPHDVAAWTEAMRRMAEDAAWRTQWQQAGPRRAAAFTRERFARATIEGYRAAVADGRR